MQLIDYWRLYLQQHDDQQSMMSERQETGHHSRVEVAHILFLLAPWSSLRPCHSSSLSFDCFIRCVLLVIAHNCSLIITCSKLFTIRSLWPLLSSDTSTALFFPHRVFTVHRSPPLFPRPRSSHVLHRGGQGGHAAAAAAAVPALYTWKHSFTEINENYRQVCSKFYAHQTSSLSFHFSLPERC
jgi:hypothetical protein